jgi:hypothetical protein
MPLDAMWAEFTEERILSGHPVLHILLQQHPGVLLAKMPENTQNQTDGLKSGEERRLLSFYYGWIIKKSA